MDPKASGPLFEQTRDAHGTHIFAKSVTRDRQSVIAGVVERIDDTGIYVLEESAEMITTADVRQSEALALYHSLNIAAPHHSEDNHMYVYTSSQIIYSTLYGVHGTKGNIIDDITELLPPTDQFSLIMAPSSLNPAHDVASNPDDYDTGVDPDTN